MDDLEKTSKEDPGHYHYYGDDIRKIFVGVGVVMLLALPFFNNILPVPAFISIISILVISLAAGLTNPRKQWTAIINTIASVIGLAVFEYYAVDAATRYSESSALFFVNQVIALAFFLALYLSTKTWRGWNK
ncbi:MAG: Uncharacterized protein G01um101419_556 [Parcubacteria group bacterium Gr01-1014_19]|nr:MAG: Uncharacterized protein G01um101419_556 [Parcubacteria group bacterium Gr01-1014_19]